MGIVQWLYWNSRTCRQLTSLLRLNDVIMSCRISAYSGTSWSLFQTLNAVSNGEQGNEYIIREGGIEKSAPRDHGLSSLGKHRDAKR